MSNNFLWTTYGVAEAGTDWDLAAIPSHNGKVTAPLNADTFRILKDTKHPDEAFEVLTYLLGEGSEQLLGIYGGMPARPEEQDAFFEKLGQRRTTGRSSSRQGVDWQVAKDSVQYADNPNFEAFDAEVQRDPGPPRPSTRPSGWAPRVSTWTPRSRRCGRSSRQSGTADPEDSALRPVA